MANFSKTDTRRITFLSLLGSAATVAAGQEVGPTEAYVDAKNWLDQMEDDGFFDEEVGSGNAQSSGRSGGSGRQGSRSRSGNSGSKQRGRDRSSGNGGFQIKDPDAPATKSQIGKLLSLTEDYTWEEAEDLTKGEISNLIDDLS